MSYFVMCLILFQLQSCGYPPWLGWTVRSEAPSSGKSVETPGIQFVTDLLSGHLLTKKKVGHKKEFL